MPKVIIEQEQIKIFNRIREMLKENIPKNCRDLRKEPWCGNVALSIMIEWVEKGLYTIKDWEGRPIRLGDTPGREDIFIEQTLSCRLFQNPILNSLLYNAAVLKLVDEFLELAEQVVYKIAAKRELEDFIENLKSWNKAFENIEEEDIVELFGGHYS